MPNDSPDGFFRNLSGLATDWVRSKRKALQTEPETNVDASGGGHRYSFGGQDLSFEDLRDIKDIRDSGGQVATLMEYKALLNFGGGTEIHVEANEETEQPVDGEPMTLTEWLEEQFPKLDLTILDLGEDALWYPYAVGEIQETQTGGFKRALPAEPWTLIPRTDERGEIQAWQQRTKSESGGYVEQTLNGEDLWHIVINKSSARDETGISEILRNREEIQAFKQNEQAINKAIELHGFPQRHVKVGREEGAPVSDNDLRRVRSIFDPRTTESNTAYFTGQDVDVETLEAHNFDYAAIHEMDMRNLTTALGLPLEAGNVGSDGLGSGKPAELRFSLLKLAIKANQRRLSNQFVERVVRPVVRDYSPFDHTAQIELDIADPLEDIGEVADLINSIGDYMTNEEARSKLDLPAPEDDEVAESYRSPADIEKSEAGDPVDESPFGGMFSDGVKLTQAKAKTLQEDFDAELFELVATEEQEDFTTGERLGVGVEFPNSGVYVDWNIAAWPEDERLDGPHVSQYATVEDARTVAQGEVRTLSAHELQDIEDIDMGDYPEAAVENAQMALDAREETGNPNDCLTDTGWAVANNLVSGDPISQSQLESMSAFERFEEDKDQGEEGRADCGWMAWKAWGGDEGIAWADDKMDELEQSRENAALSEGRDTGNRCLGVSDQTLAHVDDWDRALLEMHQGVSDPDAPTDRTLVSFASSATPAFVLERIREAVDDGAMFSQIDGVSSDQMMELRSLFKDELGEDDFTLDSLTDSIMEFSGMSRDDAERVARTEQTAVLNRSRELGYEQRGEADDELFYWTGADPGDNRQTDVCGYLIAGQGPHLENPGAFSGLPHSDGTNPFNGGTPVPMDELKELVQMAAEVDPEINTEPRTWTPHINCRSTFSKAPPGEV